MTARYRASLFAFVLAMDEKLSENIHKHSWRNMSYIDLLRRLNDECTELTRAIQDGGSPDEIVLEAADVANFAMMIADKAMKWQ